VRISAHPNKSAVGSDSSAPHSGVRSTPERRAEWLGNDNRKNYDKGKNYRSNAAFRKAA